MTPEDRLLRIENAFSTLVELAQKSDERTTKLEDIVTRLAKVTLQSKEDDERRMRDFDERLTALTDSHIRLADAQARTETALKETDERLNVFINTVERLISNGKGGAR